MSVQYENQNGQHQEVCERSEVQQTSYMQSSVKVPFMNLPTPFISTSAVLAQDLVGEGFQASISRITGISDQMESVENPQLDEEARRDLEAKQREQDTLARQYQTELERKTEAYRKAQEVEVEKIRKELEKQHLRDVEFRKEVVEMAIENQKKQIDLESRYAKKEMDRERMRARQMLEQQKFHSDIQVNMESSAAGTHAGGQVVSESHKYTENKSRQEQRP
nr:CAHS 8d [Paramacrobiotus areolatus]